MDGTYDSLDNWLLGHKPRERKGWRATPQARKKAKANRSKLPNKTRWDQRNIVAWDGEGAGIWKVDSQGQVENVHIYNLLANSLGSSIQDDRGLASQRCFDFFLANNPHSAIHCIFAGGYDVNMILRDLPKVKVRTLWQDGKCSWNGYRIIYRHRKMFSVAKKDPTSRNGYGRSFVLWDVFGYFQSSFVKAVRKWLVDDEALEYIQQMKDTRKDFSVLDIEEIRKYNVQELKLLVMLMQALCNAMDKAGIRLSRFDGAGSIASYMFNVHKVREHYGTTPEDVYRVVQISYAGGRVEAPMVGNGEQAIERYDLKSAYPAAALSLPSLRDAAWAKEKRPDEMALASLVAVEWNYSTDAPFYPLFYRTYDHKILYPKSGIGVYWHPEYDALKAHYKEGRDYQVLYAINVYGDSTERPFDFLREYYRIRKVFADAGDMAQEAIKLGINSVYGKLAQQEGYQPAIPGVRDERFPTHHCLAYASLITSHTRASLYLAGMESPNDVIAFATDAVFSTSRLHSLSIGPDMGQWERDRFGGITIVQPGVYWLKDEREGWTSKYRGFDSDSLNRNKVLDAWARGDTHLPVSLTRFVGMGAALNRTDWSIWRRWHREERQLDLYPKGKRALVESGLRDRLCKTVAIDNFAPVMSAPYPVKWVDGYRISDDDQFGRRIDEEGEDGYA